MPRRTDPESETAPEDLPALLYTGKQVELGQCRIEAVLPEQDDPGVPPRSGVDLNRGIVVLRPQSKAAGAGPSASETGAG